MFALEMLLKLLAFGPLGYIQNPYNIFDGIIVVIRWVTTAWEPTGAGEALARQCQETAPHTQQSPSQQERPCQQHFMGWDVLGQDPHPSPQALSGTHRYVSCNSGESL